MTSEMLAGMTRPRAESDAPPRTKWRLIKLLGSLLFYAASEIWRAVRAALGRESRSSYVVIYYHQVPRAHRERFARQMDHLARWTRTVATDLASQSRVPGRYVVVTADDGWKSFAENALPELKRRGIPVTLFAISDKLTESIDNIRDDRIFPKLSFGNVQVPTPRLDLIRPPTWR